MRILAVAHNHPDLHPGGTEIFSHDLFREFRSRPGIEALFLAATNRVHREPRPGTSFQAVGDAPDEVILWSGHFDHFYLSQIDTYGVVPHLENLLKEFRPDVVHIHHILLLGVEFIAIVRRVLPQARIVLTLHDYYAICAHDGLMMRPRGRERCEKASPNRCNACFPETAPDRFLLRERHLKTLFAQVDRFIAPSHFIRDRFIAWGLSPALIDVVANGRPAAQAASHRQSHDGRRLVFGYFGNINPWKGAAVLLKACHLLISEGVEGFELRLHGGTPFQAEGFVEEIEKLVRDAGVRVVKLGPYRRDEVPALMEAVDWVVVPSIWWENSPLVIQEAFLHRRPVIASGIGGMAEAVADGVNGLHVRPDDPVALARAMRRAMDELDLWKTLVEGIASPPDMAQVADQHLHLYRSIADSAQAA
ncbi:glycosyltransferase family 4 protein [Microvirga terricola]|uniref:Glycosyltransferase family 4 protein n=1 Tax=Microvirga terricola TaxID=2719797 RepID=A0ABX0VES9_9HYPH|nr:glycosyltransferase family 4 protein [Microvirga terricola]NIX78347.1 glycosyltransferase family 4 protein [Microvirga terricola]